MRTYPTEVENMIASGHVRYAHLLTMGFDTPLYFTNAGFDIVHDGKTFVSSGILNGFDELSKQASLSVTELEISFSLADSEMIAIAMGQNVYNKVVQIDHVFLGNNNESLHVERIWKGRISQHTSSDDDLLVNFVVSNVFGAFEITNSWRSTPASHHRRHPGDNCFKFAHKANEIIYWGGEATITNKKDINNDSLGTK